MNKTCARCEKTVYPTEELKCLDKVWHKGCFKCQECGMTLNMRTYKGYGKLPYCESHVPKAKHTTMAETPELKRIAENTKLQSNVKYHADFEKSKGKFTQVADDPETLRIKANSRIISNVAYHGDLEKKAQMEKQRQIENGEVVDIPSDNYHQQIENYATEMLPPALPLPNPPHKNHYQDPAQFQEQYRQPKYDEYQNQYHNQNYDEYQNQTRPDPYENQTRPEQYQNQNRPDVYHNPPRPEQYQNQNRPEVYQNQSRPEHYQQSRPEAYQNQTRPDLYQTRPDQYQNQARLDQYQNYSGNQAKIGRIQDYDPLSDGPRAPPNTQRSSATLIYNSNNDGKNRGAHQPQQQQSRQIGRVADLDPMANEPPKAAPVQQNQRVYIAIYDYVANDSDEVSFREGDLISNVSSIDSGWMTGQVLRTGRTGMLPANYVEPAPHGTFNN